ncbi:hypothetical protein Hanom_Chr06g00507221 [Helianthus anomalus]
MFLFNRLSVNTLPNLGYSCLSITIGPFKKRKSPPKTGHALTTGGRRLRDLGIKKVTMILAAMSVAIRRVMTLRSLGSKSIFGTCN